MIQSDDFSSNVFYNSHTRKLYLILHNYDFDHRILTYALDVQKSWS